MRQLAALVAVLIAATALATCRPNVQPPPPPPRNDQTDHSVTTTTPSSTTTSTTTSSTRPTFTLPPPAPTLRQRTLDTLTQLGATPEQLTIWDCIGWAESKWTNATSPTGDHGVLQINQIHLEHLARIGLDPYRPEDAAAYAYGLWLARGFQPWTTAKGCT